MILNSSTLSLKFETAVTCIQLLNITSSVEHLRTNIIPITCIGENNN